MRIPSLAAMEKDFKNYHLGYPFWKTGKREQSYSGLFLFFFFPFCLVHGVITRGMAWGFKVLTKCTYAYLYVSMQRCYKRFSWVGNRHQNMNQWSWFIRRFQPKGEMGAELKLDATFLHIDESGPQSFVHNHMQRWLLLLFKLVLRVLNLWNKTGGY